MSEATTIQEVLGILRKTPPPTFDFSRANAKFAKEKRFSVFKRENGLTTGEAIKIIKNLTESELSKPYSKAKMTERTPQSLEECAHRWVFIHKHRYDNGASQKTIKIYIKLMIPTKCPPLILVESFHESI